MINDTPQQTKQLTDQQYDDLVTKNLDLITMDKLLAQHRDAPAPTWVVEDLIRVNRERPSLLCGYPHIGKSTLARQLAVAVSKGGTFLGRKTTQGRVLYWYCEDSPLDAALDFKKAGVDSNDTITLMRASFLAENSADRIHEIECALTQARDTINDDCPEEDKSYSLVIVETMCDLLQPKNDNDNSEVSALLTSFKEKVVR